MALPVLHTFSRNKSRDAIQAGKPNANIRLHGLKGNMNADQVWTTAADACVGEDCTGGLLEFSSTCWYFGESLVEKMAAANTAQRRVLPCNTARRPR